MDSAPSTSATKGPTVGSKEFETGSKKLEGSAKSGQGASTKAAESLSVTDNRTGKSYELPIAYGTIRAADLRQIKVDSNDFGVMSYDPAFNNTASCISRITYIDGVPAMSDV